MLRDVWMWTLGLSLCLGLGPLGCKDDGDPPSPGQTASPSAPPSSPGQTATPSAPPSPSPTLASTPSPTLMPSETLPHTPSPTASQAPPTATATAPPTPTPSPTAPPDRDGDGSPDPLDCAPDDGDIYPGAPESDCTDPIDYNCDGEVLYGDSDGDGVPDCEDSESCDGLDNDGDGAIDEGVQLPYFPDDDGDGYGTGGSPAYACVLPDNGASLGGDCDDDDPKVNPGEEETDCTDPADYNCDGESPYSDSDGDGLADCLELETCDGLDNDGDGGVDEGEGLCICDTPSQVPEPLEPLGTCEADLPVGTFTPQVEWSVDSFDQAPDSYNVMMTPIVLPLTDDNGDGLFNEEDIPTIVFVTYKDTEWTGSGEIRSFKGDGSGEVFTILGSGISATGGLAGGDIDGDGRVEIVGVTVDGEAIAYNHDASLLWRSEPLPLPRSTYSQIPALADLEGDGEVEIIIGNVIVDHRGKLKAQGAYGSGAAGGLYGLASAVADIDLDGQQEVIVGNAAYGPRGQALYFNGRIDGPVALGNFDDDPFAEVAVVAGGQVRLQEHDGSLIWSSPLPGEASSYGGPPTIADFDGDGAPEIGVANFGAYTVFDSDGGLLWNRSTTDNSSGVTGSSVFDFEGDGVAEVIYADEVRLWAFSGPTGTVKLEEENHSNWTVVEYPPIADVDGDGQAEIIVPNGLHPEYPTLAKRGIVVIGDANQSWRPARRIWNQHAYHITNVEDDGSIPRSPEPSWLTWNAFRSGDITQGAGEGLPDLFPEVVSTCTQGCGEGTLTLWVRIGNQGSRGVVGDVDLGVFIEGPEGDIELAVVSAPGPHPAGYLGGAMALEIRTRDITGEGPLIIRADYDARGGDGVAVECNESNNRLLIAQPCP